MKKIQQMSLLLLVVFGIAVSVFTIIFWFGTPPSLVQNDGQAVTVHGSKIAYQIHGQGKEALLLIHSAAWSSAEYNALAESLSKQYTVYLVDLPGYGRSDKPQLRYSLQKLTAMMTEFIEQFPEKKFHLIGASTGGTISVLLAAQFPERIQTVTLIDPIGFGQDINQVALVAQVPIVAELLLYPNQLTFHYVLNQGWLTDHGNITPDLADQLYHDAVLPKASRAKLSLLRSLITVRGVAPDVLALVNQSARQLHQPVLLLWGEEDSYAQISQHQHALTLLPQATYHPIPQAGHFPQLEQPDLVANYLQEFLQAGS